MAVTLLKFELSSKLKHVFKNFKEFKFEGVPVTAQGSHSEIICIDN